MALYSVGYCTAKRHQRGGYDTALAVPLATKAAVLCYLMMRLLVEIELAASTM